MFAIVRIAGKQYKVTQDAIIDVDRIDGEEGATLTFTDVLLTSEKDSVTVGEPIVAGAKVVAKVVKQLRGDKIDVRRYKSKVRYRKAIGFRPSITRLQITSL